MEMICRLVATSIILATPFQFSVEFETSKALAPDGVALCFDRPFVDLRNSTLESVHEGGNQFDTSSEVAIDITSTRGAFRSYAGLPLYAVSNLGDILSNDPYFATSYDFQRYDDFTMDGHGSPKPKNHFHVKYSPKATAGDQAVSPTLVQTGPTAANCAALFGAFKAATRYQLTINLTSSASTVGWANTRMWMAPLSINNGDAAQGVSVRGPKYGRFCETRVGWNTTAAPVTSCSSGLLSPRYGGECVSCPSATTSGCSCPVGVITRFVGLDPCGPAIGEELLSLTTPPGSPLASLDALSSALCTFVGFPDVPCGPRQLTGSLGVSLQFAPRVALLQQESLSDAIVGEAYVPFFLRLARQLVDEHAYRLGNATLFAQYLADGRQPYNPTRKHGILPNCQKCSDGFFVDSTTGELMPVHDFRFRALAALRLIGLLLQNSGHSCPQLFDPSASPVIGVSSLAPWPPRDIQHNKLQPGEEL